MNRLSGLFFDVMIVSGIAAIDWQNLTGLLIPLILVCIFGAIGTFCYIKWICKKIYPNYEYEAFFSIFGMLTGTASTGMILLREIDPNFETPASQNLVLQQLPAIIFVAPLLLMVGFAGQNLTNTLIVFAVIVVMFIVYNIILLRKYIFKKKNK
jgi:ESS family glutamate:Na+ symporter